MVIAASWSRSLDDYSDNYIDDSIIQAGSSYAIARGINGIVSVLQTSTIEAEVGVGASIEIGEILDPINDLIERFSSVMSMALGSLVLQKILLVISEHSIFKVTMTILGIIVSIALVLGKPSATAFASRLFAILFFVRFSLVFVVALNSVVDDMFISEKITTGSEELNQFKTEVSQIENSDGISETDLSGYKENIRQDNLEIDEINATILPSIKTELSNEKEQLANAEKDLEKVRSKVGWLARLNPLKKDRDVVQAERRVENHKTKIKMLKTSIETKVRRMKQLRQEIEFSENRLTGKPVGTWETIKSKMPSIGGLKKSLSPSVIGDNITNNVSNVINLSMLFILKTILIPLGFFFVFIKAVKGLWDADVNSFLLHDKKSG